MGKSRYGYSEKKLKSKADKRGISIESYVRYLSFRQATRGGRAKTD